MNYTHIDAHIYFFKGEEEFGWQWVPEARKPDGYRHNMGRAWLRKIPMGLLIGKRKDPLGVVGVEVANTYPLTRRPANAS
jgi:hypothetical protein